MTDTSPPSTEPRSHPPLWLVEGLDIVEQRRSVLLAVTIGVIALGGILAVLAPGLVPPVPIVGAAVGLAALLLGLAVAVALDATDLRLRGPRHVGAAGGELVAVLPTLAEKAGAETLAEAVLAARVPGSPLLLGLAASGRDVRPTVAWTDALATALEAGGVSVLRIDLASGHTRSAGLLEVVRDGVKLASAVTFGPEPKVARLGAGADLAGALGTLSSLPGRLPRDLDVLLVALPMAATRPVVTAVRSLDHVLIVAQRDRTSRVELIAGLDALEAAGTRAQVALLDDRTAARLARRSLEVAAEPESAPDVADDTTVDAAEPAGSQPLGARRSGPSASGPAHVAEPEPEKVPVAVAEVGDAVDEVKDAGETDDTTEDRAPENLEADVEHAPEAEPASAPGPRSGAALGIGAAALAAAGVATAFEIRAARADTEPGESDAPPGEEPYAAPPYGSTHDDGSEPQLSERREVEVVHGAAEAAAIALVQLPVEPAFETDGVATVAEGALPVGADALPVETAPDLPPAPVALEMPAEAVEPDESEQRDGSDPFAAGTSPSEGAGESPSDVADLHRTDDEIAAVEPSAAISDTDAERDEMMRTTAQLSVLLDDLDLDGDERPLDTS